MDLPAGNVGISKSLNTTRPRVQVSRAAWHCYLNVANKEGGGSGEKGGGGSGEKQEGEREW